MSFDALIFLSILFIKGVFLVLFLSVLRKTFYALCGKHCFGIVYPFR